MNGEMDKFYKWLKPSLVRRARRWPQARLIHIDTRDQGHFTNRPEVRPAKCWSY